MANTLSNKHKNKVNIHDNSCHIEEYLTAERLESHIHDIKKEISGFRHDDLLSSNDNKHIDWTVKQDTKINPINIELDIKQYEGAINHNNLYNTDEMEHIDWSIEQSINIHPSNIMLPHTKLNDQHIPHSRVAIKTGNGLSGGGTIEATRTINLKPATEEQLGGVKIGYGLESSIKDRKLNVDTQVICHKREIKISTEEWEKLSSNKYMYSINLDKYPTIFCWDLKYNKVIYPEIKIQDHVINIFMKRKLDMLIKITY